MPPVRREAKKKARTSPRTGKAPPSVEEIRSNLDPFFKELSWEDYRGSAGLTKNVDTERIFRKYARICSAEALRETLRAHRASAGSGEAERRLRLLAESMTWIHVDRELAPLNDRLETEEATGKVTIYGKKVAFRASQVMLANEVDRGRRRTIYTARLGFEEKMRPHYERKWMKAHELSRSLGYSDYREMCERIGGFEFDGLDRIVEALLAKTARPYEEEAGEMLGAVGVGLRDAERHDVTFAFRGTAYDQLFPAARLVPAFRETLAGLGIDLAKQKNVVLDLESRPSKVPRAACFPMDPPDKVYLIVLPQGGYDDYESLFHEGGHAEHFAHVTKSLEVEYRHLGDNSLTEGYAALLEYVVRNPVWLENVMRLPASAYAPFLTFSHARELMMLRRYCAKFRYELKLHSGRIKEAGALYRKALESELLFAHPEVLALSDLDSGFYAARYLRSWLLEATLRLRLIEDLGESWCLDARAGKFLRDLWAQGQRWTAEELCVEIGFPGLEAGPLLKVLEI